MGCITFTKPSRVRQMRYLKLITTVSRTTQHTTALQHAHYQAAYTPLGASRLSPNDTGSSQVPPIVISAHKYAVVTSIVRFANSKTAAGPCKPQGLQAAILAAVSTKGVCVHKFNDSLSQINREQPACACAHEREYARITRRQLCVCAAAAVAAAAAANSAAAGITAAATDSCSRRPASKCTPTPQSSTVAKQ
jgi:hypothetical protein